MVSRSCLHSNVAERMPGSKLAPPNGCTCAPPTSRPQRSSSKGYPPDQLGRGMDVLGWREWVVFPDLGLPPVQAKVDTGAKTSSLHVLHHHRFLRGGREWVRFQVPLRRPLRSPDDTVTCQAQYLEHRLVRDSSGRQTLRPVVWLTIQLGSRAWPVELTLADRSQNGFCMLLGRQALRGRYLVDPERSHCMQAACATHASLVVSDPRTPRWQPAAGSA